MIIKIKSIQSMGGSFSEFDFSELATEETEIGLGWGLLKALDWNIYKGFSR